MTNLNNYLEIKREMLQAQLKVIYLHKRKTLPHKQKLKRKVMKTRMLRDIIWNMRGSFSRP